MSRSWRAGEVCPKCHKQMSNCHCYQRQARAARSRGRWVMPLVLGAVAGAALGTVIALASLHAPWLPFIGSWHS